MNYKTEYLKIHEKVYKRLRSGSKASWSEAEDLNERTAFYHKAIHNFKIKSDARALVIGCGDGETSLSLSKSGYKVTGVDISPTAIQWAQEKALERNIKCSFFEADLTLGFPELGQFDVIIDDHCLHCIIGEDRKTILNETNKMLNENGIFVMRTHCGNPPQTAPDDFLKTWDSISRCQVHGGVAGRYFGLPEDILLELKSSNFLPLQHRVFYYPNGWGMLEVVAKIN
ncbi:MAG: class I SAM-dependent methyltransferase [Bdellovibrio sp.]